MTVSHTPSITPWRWLALSWMAWTGCGPTSTAPIDDTPSADLVEPTPDSDIIDSDTPSAFECSVYKRPAPGVQGRPTMRAELVRPHPNSEQCLAVEDFDGDGSLDIVTATLDDLHIAWGSANGDWQHDTIRFPEDHEPGQQTVCSVRDVDHDGRLDIAIAMSDRIAIAHVSAERTVSLDVNYALLDPAPLVGVNHIAWVDLDGDHQVELIVGEAGRILEDCVSVADDPGDADITVETEILTTRVRCMSHDGQQWSDAPSLCPDKFANLDASNTNVLLIFDANDDGRQDALIATDFGDNHFMVGTDDGWRTGPATSGLHVYDHAMGVALADYDGDGLRDIYLSDVGPDSVYVAADCTLWFDQTFLNGVGAATGRTISWGAWPLDADLDGDPDILTTVSMEVVEGGFTQPFCELEGEWVSDTHDLLLVNDGTGHFSRVEVEEPPGSVRTPMWHTIYAAPGDLDGDGDLDVVTLSRRGLHVLRNTSEHVGHWLAVRPLDDQGAPAIGASVVVSQQGGARRQDIGLTHGMSSQGQLTAHFGLGMAEVQRVDVRWPDGRTAQVEVDQVDRVIQISPPTGTPSP